MKKLNKLTHIFIFIMFCSGLIISCGTEEEPQANALTVTLSSSSVQVGNPVNFTASSLNDGDLTSVATFFVNGEQIEGNTFVPTEANDSNEVYATYNGLTSPVVNFSSFDFIPSEYTQKVLIEDYTGTWCTYCPRMAQILDFFVDYSENVIPVAIHCEGNEEDPWVYEYWQQMAATENYNANGQPKGKINRIYPVNMLEGVQPCPNDPTGYYPQIDPYLNQAAPLGLAINSTLSGNSLNIQVKVGFATGDISNAKLVVNLIEEGLTYDQKNGYYGSSFPNCPFNQGEYNQNPIPDFPQKHVLLKSFTDIFGDAIPANEVADGNIWTKDLNVSLPSNVTNANNLYLVAFVVGNGDEISTRAVLNVQRAKVGTTQNFD